MKKINNKFTELYSLYEPAKNEECFPSHSLSEELLPLLDDYFVGDFYKNDDGIVMSFLNGQKFILSAKKLD